MKGASAGRRCQTLHRGVPRRKRWVGRSSLSKFELGELSDLGFRDFELLEWVAIIGL